MARSLRRNYDPHIEPDADHAPETTELRNVLLASASTMLTDFLRKTRVARRKGGGARGVDSRKIDIVSYILNQLTTGSGHGSCQAAC